MYQPPFTALPQRVVLTALALAIAGCAQIPALDSLAKPRDAAGYDTAQAFTAPAAQWPSERWWQAYGDSQLDALIDEALRDAPDLAAASARLRRAEATGQIAGAPLLPQVSANASANEQRQSYNYLTPKSMTPEGWQDYGRATLDFSWELDFWGKNRAALAAATSETEASRAEFAQARLSLAAAIGTDYMELARLFAARDTAARSVEIRSKTATLFAERFANGLETKGSLREADARRASAEGELLQIDEQIGLQRYRLAALLGAGPDRGLKIVRPTINLNRSIGLPGELAANLLGRRPDIVAARLRTEAQLKRIDAKKAEFYPNINLAGFIGFQSLGLNLLSKSDSTTGSIGPAISLPIFTGGRLSGELRGTAAAYDEAVANYNLTVTQALQQVANAALSQKSLGSRLAKSEEAVAAATEAYRIASNRYEGHLSSYLEVLSAEDAMLNNLRILTDLRSRAFTLDVALMHALGGGYSEAPAIAKSRPHACRNELIERNIPMSQNTPVSTNANEPRRNKLLLALGGVVGAAAVVTAAYWYLYGSHFVSTDNAYAAVEIAQVTPSVGGTISEVRVTDTQSVKKGDVLVVIDPTDAKLALAQAEADLGSAIRRVRGYVANDSGLSAQIAARAADERRAAAQLASAEADFERAKIDLQRREALSASGSVSGDELTRAQNAFAAAEANLTVAKAATAQAKANRDAAIGSKDANAALIANTTEETNPEVALARARRDQAAVDLERTVIRAPVDGVVAKRQVQIGQRVQAGTPLLAVVPIHEMHVDANFKEVQLEKVRTGQPVTLTADIYGNSVTYTGVVEGFSGGSGAAFAAIPAQNATGNWIKVVQRVPVRIKLDPEQLASNPLRVGLSMTARIDTRGNS